MEDKIKTYTSKSGKKFRIVNFATPADGDVIYLTRGEFEYAKANLKPEEFDVAWMLKSENYLHEIIPDSVIDEKKEMALKYSQAIIDQLTGKNVPDTSNDG